MLWYKLRQQGVNGKFYFALRSLYRNTECSVMLNGLQTPYFDVECGLRQGCNLSPLLLNICINELAEHIQKLNRGVVVIDNNVSILMYADHAFQEKGDILVKKIFTAKRHQCDGEL